MFILISLIFFFNWHRPLKARAQNAIRTLTFSSLQSIFSFRSFPEVKTLWNIISAENRQMLSGFGWSRASHLKAPSASKPPSQVPQGREFESHC